MAKRRLLIVCLIVAAFIAGYSVSNQATSPKVDTIRSASQSSNSQPITRSVVTSAPKIETSTPKTSPTEYVLNTNTKKFHKPSCSSVKQMKEKNKKVVTWTRQEIIDAGYDPCGRCHP